MFDAPFFAPVPALLQGALVGLVFGFLLHKAGVTKWRVIVDQLRLRDFTVLKVMLTAIVVGGAGLYAFHGLGRLDDLHVKSTHLLANALGGLLFGVGMALLGYCPGTAVGAAATGSRHAWFGILGMFAGAIAYAEFHPWAARHLLPIGDLGKVTLPEVLGAPAFFWILLLALVDLALFFWQDRPLRTAQPPQRPEPGAAPHAH